MNFQLFIENNLAAWIGISTSSWHPVT